jgi:hypothetical protein
LRWLAQLEVEQQVEGGNVEKSRYLKPEVVYVRAISKMVADCIETLDFHKLMSKPSDQTRHSGSALSRQKHGEKLRAKNYSGVFSDSS